MIVLCKSNEFNSEHYDGKLCSRDTHTSHIHSLRMVQFNMRMQNNKFYCVEPIANYSSADRTRYS